MPILMTMLDRASEAGASAAVRRRVSAPRRLCTVTLTVLASTLAGASAAQAAGVTIASPENGSVINTATPTFTGTDDESLCPLPLTLPVEVTLTGSNGQENVPVTTHQECSSSTWSAVPLATLRDGSYTAEAKQGEASQRTSFTVVTTPPQVSITSPASGSSAIASAQVLSGSAGGSRGDSQTVKLAVYAGAGTEPQAYLQTVEKPVVNGAWSATVGGLAPGVYTARAEQSDWAGNVGQSAPVTFRLLAAGAPALPAASFVWFPSAPSVGQRISLVSTSADTASPISSYAWDLAGNGQFKPGGPVLTTSFGTTGNHVVHLRVTDARGYSSTATQTIPVVSPQLTLMQPFPIVRIAGTVTSSGVNLSLLAVQSPVGATVTVSCHGRGCRPRSESRFASASRRKRGGAVLLDFRRFERSLRAGVILEIRVIRPGQIGKYTRFSIRRRGLPARLDECLASTDPRPIVCPA